MASSEERMMILRMVEEGKVTPEEGAQLLAAMGEREAAAETAGASAGYTAGQGWAGAAYGDNPAFRGDFEGATTPGGLGSRVFHVRVTNGMTGKHKVDINIPLSLVDFGLRFVPPSSKVDVQKLRDAIAGGTRGRIIDVMDSEKGDHVEIFFE